MLAGRTDGEDLGGGAQPLAQPHLSLPGPKPPEISRVREPRIALLNVQAHRRAGLASDHDRVETGILEGRAEPAADGRVSVPGRWIDPRRDARHDRSTGRRRKG